MTTTVTVHAHCSENKHVEVRVNENVEKVLENGQSTDVYAYDDREIRVKEVLKSE